MNASEFARGLSQHGYAFQYRVAHEIQGLIGSREIAGWQLVACELPVVVRGLGTKIDLVFQKHDGLNSSDLMVIECKRVNPKFGVWFFAKSPHPFPDFTSGQLAIEGVRCTDAGVHEIEIRGASYVKRCFHIGVALKSQAATGDMQPVSNDRDAIEEACGQVCLGAAGLATILMQKRYLRSLVNASSFVVVPTVITTAKLYATEVTIEDSDLVSGELDLPQDAVEEMPWLVYQYMQSPERIVKRGRIHERPDDVFGEIAGDCLRSVIVVNAGHILDFLRFYDRRI